MHDIMFGAVHGALITDRFGFKRRVFFDLAATFGDTIALNEVLILSVIVQTHYVIFELLSLLKITRTIQCFSLL